ncbi:MAG: hypothetical protein LC647_07480, partial [Beggiatoa sp.]|nr:hypothetical protein [Beggiatoa sp.]
NYFRGARRRVLVLFTDAETKRIAVEQLTGDFDGTGIETILLRFWGAGERIYGPDGVEQAYVPDPASPVAADTFARAVKGEAFEERELEGAIQSVRSKLGSESSITRVKTVDIEPVGPYVLLAALLPLSFLLVRRNVT